MARGMRIGVPTEQPEFSTTFSSDESPLGAPWTNARAAGFTPMRSSGGLAYGDGGSTGNYDDSYAYLSGYNADHECEGTFYVNAPPDVNHENELHVRMSDDPDTDEVYSYEALINKDGNVQIMKWRGPMGDGFFFELYSGQLASTPGNGDKARLRATTSGANCVLTLWYTFFGEAETQIAQVTDTGAVGGAVHTSGQPGIAYFRRDGSDPTKFAWTAYAARNV